MAAYYNEIDPYAAQWLRNLIREGLIADGEVDERDIRDVQPVDLIGFDQCHFFAGIGVWSYALRLAGWPDDRPVWTGSCPCQPFSAAGARTGFADERHLWPAWFHLIEVHRPRVVFGEQVASKHGLAWLDLVYADLEAAGYAVGAVDLCAAGVGAPHIRQRLWFVAESDRQQRDGIAGGEGRKPDGTATGRQQGDGESERGRAVGELAHAAGLGHDGWRASEALSHAGAQQESERLCAAGDGLGHADEPGPQGRGLSAADRGRDGAGELAARTPGPVNGFWADADWLPCTDGKARPVEPGTFPLAHGAPARVGRLRAYGNAIVAQAAAEFIKAYRC